MKIVKTFYFIIDATIKKKGNRGKLCQNKIVMSAKMFAEKLFLSHVLFFATDVNTFLNHEI